MDQKPFEIPFLSTIGYMLTYKCTVACPHCIVEAGPHRKEEMQTEDALAWIEAASEYRGVVKGIALTGGEPFYSLAKLGLISSYAKAQGLIVSVVTNAFWASTEEMALEVLYKLPAIQLISISTDIYHQRSIPFDFPKNAIRAARKLGRLYNIAVCTDNEEDSQYQKIIEELKAMGEDERITVAKTFPVGRAQKVSRWRYPTSPEPAPEACALAGSPVIFPNGDVSACIGPLLTLPTVHPMLLGNLHNETLPEILDRAEMNALLHMIRVWGPHKLVSLLKQHGFDALLPKEYISDCVCDVCYKLLSDQRIVGALRQIAQEKELPEMVAWARVYYLNEETMVERMELAH